MAEQINTNRLAFCCYANHTIQRHILWLILLCLITTTMLHAQNDIILQDPVVGKADVWASNSVSLKPGFHARAGSDFRAHISTDPKGQNSSTTIDPPTGNATPAAGSTGNNFVKAITYSEPRLSEPTSSFRHLEEIKYFDGLGRPSQIVQVGASPTEKDIIQPILYDDFGREAIKTLPYTGTKTGEFRSGDVETMKTTVNTYYSSSTPDGIVADSRAFTSIVFENSPLNRVLSQTGPGNEWATNSKSIRTNYLANTSTTGWTVTGDYSYSSFSYDANKLYVTETIDEQDNATREYKDFLGQVVMKESKLDGNWLHTAYIYDDFGLLRCVVPPEASGPEDNNLCYYYLYDDRKRMIEKKIPGGGTVKMVYDKRDRLRATQNSEQAVTGEWTFTKYDEFNRPIITGTIVYTGDIKTAVETTAMNEIRNNTQANYGYTSDSYPLSGAVILTATYYDDYSFIPGMSLNDSLNSIKYDAGSYNFSSITDLSPKGQVTGTMTRVLSASADNGAVPLSTLYSTMYYDKYGHLLRSISENHLKGKDIISNIYEDITYKVLRSKQEHYKGSDQVIIEKWFEYDHTGRLLATEEQINDQPKITLNAMKYNEVGEMITKYLHSNNADGNRSFIQKTDYQYNIRGWLTKINDAGLGGENDMFGMQLFYNSVTGMGSLAPSSNLGLFNGNIVGMKWGIRNEPVRGYQFSYDNLNRMLQANYAEGSSLDANSDYYSEIITGYDKNGNIQGLQRKYNNTLVDNLDYDYCYSGKSNQLLKITDTGTGSNLVDDYPGTSQDYVYDANGNMKKDGAKNFDIYYNPTLNLPKELNFGGNNRIFYHYTATGAKLAKHTVPGSGTGALTHYIGNIVYEGGTLSYILTEEGRLVADGTGANRKFYYEYNLKDHLGNSRVTFMGTDLGGAVDIVQTTSYYPFGLVMSQKNTETSYLKNKYLYNGKELQNDKMTNEALSWYDYGARMYDPQLGRFHTQDAFAEKYFSLAPYQYCANNPILFVDVNGDSIFIGDAISQNKQLAAAFAQFAGTKQGMAYLSKYAAKGQSFTIGGKTFSFDKDGAYSTKGVDLTYTGKDMGDGGVWGPKKGNTDSQTNNEGGMDITITMNTNSAALNQDNDGNTLKSFSEKVYNSTGTFFHESFIHGYMGTKDFLDNGKLDYSNISAETKRATTYTAHYQHYQVLLNEVRGNNTGLWPGSALQGLQQVNTNLNLNRTTETIKYIMWNYNGGKQ